MTHNVAFNRAVLLAMGAAMWMAPIVAHAEDPIASNNGPTPPFEGCRFYEHRDYGGHHFDINSNHDYSWMGGAWNDKISSFACSAGCTATLFEDRDFGGANVTWGGFIEYVGSFWNDRTSSIKIACSGGAPAGGTAGGDRCRTGYVWREARRNDHVCVPPEARDRTQAENAVAPDRWNPSGAWGRTTCVSGFVWREAFEGDHVCVTPNIRDVVREENQLGPSRKE
jgi:hypothetical protein